MKTNELNTEELAQAARNAYADQQWDEFWSEFEDAASVRDAKVKDLAAPREMNTTY